MDNIHCRVAFDNRHESAGFIARKEAEYCLTSRGDLIEHTTYCINGRKFIIVILAAVSVFVVIIGACTVYAHGRKTWNVYEESGTPSVEEPNVTIEIITEELTIYDRCSSEYLSEEEAWEIYEQEGPFQLQFYINLMYARHGYDFGSGNVNDIYFNKQEWYQKLEKEICYEDLNSFEQKNSDLFVKILEAEGYRD